MKYVIHFLLPDDIEDHIVVEGESVEDIRQQADIEVSRRGGTDPWSEPLSHVPFDHIKYNYL